MKGENAPMNKDMYVKFCDAFKENNINDNEIDSFQLSDPPQELFPLQDSNLFFLVQWL